MVAVYRVEDLEEKEREGIIWGYISREKARERTKGIYVGVCVRASVD